MNRKLTPREVEEARDLLDAHSGLRWNMARNGSIGVSNEKMTRSLHLGPKVTAQAHHVLLGLIEARLAALGVEPDRGLETDCHECAGTGKRDMT